MAIYHLSFKVISRANGSSAIASAAYRSASRLYDQRLDRAQDFTHKTGVVHSEVLLPEGAPEAWSDRERLWNDVEAFEKRKDAQLSRELEFAIPREMTQGQGIALARDFVQQEFVARGMIADLNVHWDIGANGLARPHAHVMLSMREIAIDEDGQCRFGPKVRDWNRVELVEHWREAWAGHVNERLAELDIEARIDHRSLEAQGIDLEPQDKMGAAARRRLAQGLEAERIDDHHDIAWRNGERIIKTPRIALDAITQQQATFIRRDLAMFIHRQSDGAEQFNAAMSAVRSSPDLIELGQDGRGEQRFTSREMIATEQRLEAAAQQLAEQARHRVLEESRAAALKRSEARGLSLSGEQKTAFEHVTDNHDLSVIIGYAGTGKSALLGIAREAWEADGYSVRGIALSGIAAENLEDGSGIASRTIASLEYQWAKDRERLTSHDVLVIDEAGMVGTRQMARILAHAAEAGAKVVLVGDPEQLQAIEAGAAFRAIHERHGGVEITEVRRQREDWQREATRHLATERTPQALYAYHDRGHIHEAATRDDARRDLIDNWDRDRQHHPTARRLILTHTHEEVRALNALARERLRQAGELGAEVAIPTERGERVFAPGDRVLFLKNERGLDEHGGVKNGTLGTAERVSINRLSVRLDDGRNVSFDLKDYNHLDHGYAVTIHKSQGATVDRAHVLATPGLDRHATYVALSRHRDSMSLHYGQDDFADLNRLGRTLARERAKDMALDHDGARAFAERRGIGLGERIEAMVRKASEKVRSLFDGLDLGQAKRTVNTELKPDLKPEAKLQPQIQVPTRGMFDGFRPTPSVPHHPGKEPDPTFAEDREALRRRAVQRHAGAVNDIFSMHRRDLPVLPHQTAALSKARGELDRFERHASHDLEQAYRRDPVLASEAAGGRVQRALRTLQLEADLRLDPVKRADRFVEDWTQMNTRRLGAERAGDTSTGSRLRDQMGAMIKRMERDPQVESLLRLRKHAIGLGADVAWDEGRRLGHDLGSSIGLGISRGHSIGM